MVYNNSVVMLLLTQVNRNVQFNQYFHWLLNSRGWHCG